MFITAARGTATFPIRGGDRGGKSVLSIMGGIKMGEGKRGLGIFPLGEEWEGSIHLSIGVES